MSFSEAVRRESDGVVSGLKVRKVPGMRGGDIVTLLLVALLAASFLVGQPSARADDLTLNIGPAPAAQWVPPVYQNQWQNVQVWVPPTYNTVSTPVWHPPVYRQQWVPPRGRVAGYFQSVMVAAGWTEFRTQKILAAAGYYSTQLQLVPVMVQSGYWYTPPQPTPDNSSSAPTNQGGC